MQAICHVKLATQFAVFAKLSLLLRNAFPLNIIFASKEFAHGL